MSNTWTNLNFVYVIVHGCSCCCCLCFELPASATFQPTVSPKTGRLQRWKCFRRKKSTLYLDLSAPEVNYDLKKWKVTMTSDNIARIAFIKTKFSYSVPVGAAQYYYKCACLSFWLSTRSHIHTSPTFRWISLWFGGVATCYLFPV